VRFYLYISIACLVAEKNVLNCKRDLIFCVLFRFSTFWDWIGFIFHLFIYLFNFSDNFGRLLNGWMDFEREMRTM
jgi:hypothetical protein